MSQATRCTACGTVFRVVPDQLRVSEGWVRCGRCAEVFNAVENLVDPPLTPAGTTNASVTASAGAAMARMGAVPAPGRAEAVLPRSAAAADIDVPLDPAPDAWPAGDRDVSADPDDPDERYAASSLPPSGFDPSPPLHPLPASAAGAPAADRSPAQALPSFVRRADRAARWQQPRVRAALAAVALLGLLGLLGQAAHSYRDLLAARWPAAQPLLAQACAVLGCTVQPPRLIDALVVDSSGLLRVERSSVYKLSVTLRNRDALAVALPALDLTLTDTQGRLVSRRALRMDELGQTQTSLAAGAELVLQATLQTPETAGAAVAGYTIDLFYP